MRGGVTVVNENISKILSMFASAFSIKASGRPYFAVAN